MISHLTGRAEKWATAEWGRRSEICSSQAVFSKALTQVFQYSASGREAARALLGLRQGNRRVTDYAIEFRTLSVECGWNTAALTDAFVRGLNSRVKEAMIPLDLPEELDPLIALAA